MDSSFVNRMVGCEFAYEIWERIETYFASQMRAKIRSLKTQLKASKKQGPVRDYLPQIRKIVDTLAVVGSPISTEKCIELILDGLNEDYSSFITIVMSQTQPLSTPELEALLMTQEEMIERFRKTDVNMVQALLTRSSLQDSKNSQDSRNANQGQGQGQGRGNGGRRGQGRGF